MIGIVALFVILDAPKVDGTVADVGRKAVAGYAAGASTPLRATIKGPSSWVLEVCGAAKVTSTMTLTRDGVASAQGTVTLGAAKKPNCTGVVAFAVPAGTHQYDIAASEPVVVVLTSTAKLLKSHAIGAETPATAAPKAETVAAASTSDDQPSSMPTASGSAHKFNTTPALRIAVYDFELEGVPKNIGTVVTESVLQEVRKLQGASAIGMNEIRDMLAHEATKQLAGCSEDSSSCLADLAGALGVDDLITGKLTRIDKSDVITVRRIDQKHAKVAGVFDKRLEAGTGQAFLATVGPAVKDLYPMRELKSGYVRGVSKDVGLRLDPPPVPVWATVSLAGLAGATAIVGGIFGVLALTSQADYNSELATAKTQVISGAALVAKGNQASQRATIANGLFISAGAVAVATVVVALFTDWKGYRHANDTQ